MIDKLNEEMEKVWVVFAALVAAIVASLASKINSVAAIFKERSRVCLSNP